MLYNKDSAKLLEDIAENSVHAVVTDPNYGIHIMNHEWDKTLPPQEIWSACFKVLRPGGFLLSCAHVRMVHRLVCQLEDVGFIAKDLLCWATAQGFPHSHDISKAFDEDAGAERPVVAQRVHPTLKNKPRVKSNAYHADTLTAHEHIESWDITAPVTENAKKWNGWGTQLKPSYEPITLCQKPLEGSYIENIAKWHVGALNIDDCRIPYASEEDKKSLESFLHFENKDCGKSNYFSANEGGKKQVNIHPGGRWPANLLYLDPLFADYDKFFMIPKPAKREKRAYNTHDTVKPVRLMERLITLVSPKPSIVNEEVFILDPFMGSGSCGVAAKNLNRSFYGYEIDPEMFKVAERRIDEKTLNNIFEE